MRASMHVEQKVGGGVAAEAAPLSAEEDNAAPAAAVAEMLQYAHA